MDDHVNEEALEVEEVDGTEHALQAGSQQQLEASHQGCRSESSFQISLYLDLVFKFLWIWIQF